MNHSEEQVSEIIGEFRKLGVRKCGATHCTGEKQIDWIRKAFGGDFVPLGAGRVLKFIDGRLAN